METKESILNEWMQQLQVEKSELEKEKNRLTHEVNVRQFKSQVLNGTSLRFDSAVKEFVEKNEQTVQSIYTTIGELQAKIKDLATIENIVEVTLLGLKGKL